MTKDYDKIQKPDEKSPEHDKKGQTHNKNERGLGAEKSPDDPKDYKVADLFAKEGIAAAAIDFPDYYVIPNRPPIRNQGTSPMCVAYSSGYDQSHMDRPEIGKYFDPWETKFFAQIGGTSAGAFMRNALDRRKNYGYPVENVGNRSAHRISAYYRVPLTLPDIQTALTLKPLNGGVLMLGPWYHSWFHTFTSGKLPYPDYYVGGHAWWVIGWNDNYGLIGQNSWGIDYGKGGLFYMPYSYIPRMWEVWRTVDR
jgi:hypothetical protein